MIELFTLKSFVFFFGLSVGIIIVSILWLVMTFREYTRNVKERETIKRKAHNEGYTSGRKWKEREKEFFACEIAVLKEDINRLQKRL